MKTRPRINKPWMSAGLCALFLVNRQAIAEPVVTDPVSHRVQAWAVLPSMMAIAFDRDGNAIVGRDENGAVTPWPVRIVSPDGFVSDFGPAIDDPDSVLVDNDGILVAPVSILIAGGVAGSTTQRISVLTSNGLSFSVLYQQGAPSPVLDNPGDMEFDSLGRLLLANFGSAGLPAPGPGTLSAMTNDTPFVLHNLGPSRLSSVATSPGGRIFVSLFGNSTEIREVIENGSTMDVPVVTNVNGALTYSVGGFGDMTKPLLAGTGQNVRRINPDTGEFETFASGFVGISDIKFAPDGCLTVADRTGGRLWRLCECESNIFDLAVFKSNLPGPVPTGSNFTYTVKVWKYCPMPATGVTVTDMLPAGFNLVSATPSQGNCVPVVGGVSCNLGTLTNTQPVTIDVTVVATIPGQFTNTVSVTANEIDPNALNDADHVVTTVVQGAPPEAHDLAAIRLKAPKNINLKGANASSTKRVVVQIENRSPHDETIPDLDTLRDILTVTVESLGECPNLEARFINGPPNKVKTLKPKQKLNVFYEITFTGECVNDPARSSNKDPGHEDYRYTAVVSHFALDGNADTHPEDDDCPRAALPGGVDDNAGKPIKDKGCGNKDKVTKQVGADVLTDVVVK